MEGSVLCRKRQRHRQRGTRRCWTLSLTSNSTSWTLWKLCASARPCCRSLQLTTWTCKLLHTHRLGGSMITVVRPVYPPVIQTGTKGWSRRIWENLAPLLVGLNVKSVLHRREPPWHVTGTRGWPKCTPLCAPKPSSQAGWLHSPIKCVPWLPHYILHVKILKNLRVDCVALQHVTPVVERSCYHAWVVLRL